MDFWPANGHDFAVKLRMLDLLQSTCGTGRLRLGETSEIKTVPFSGKFSEVRCRDFCGLKDCPVKEANVTAADCTACYSKEVVQGELVSETGERYPITDGIPRLLSRSTNDFLQKNKRSFSLEWKYSRPEERNWGQDIEFRKRLFLQAFGTDPDSLRGKLILDAGCGSGLLAMEMAGSFGMEVVALDLATGIETASKTNQSPFVHFIQASVLELPLKDHIFDFVYCAGVLIHLPDTKAAFDLLPRVLKPAGRCFIWVYHPVEKHDRTSDRVRETVYQWVRSRISSRLPIAAQECIYLCLVIPFVIKRALTRLFGKTGEDRTWREKMQNFIDTFSPTYVNRHTEEEVLAWYRRGGFANCAVAYKERYGFGVRGDLQDAHSQ
jgi:ubiquinone/menaquinone biosynthesis C-methylase UbiE/uncharacterized protein YbaR (Trm112 family)